MNSVLSQPQHCYTILCWRTHTSLLREPYQIVMNLYPLGSWLARAAEWRSPGCCRLAMFQWKTNTQQSLASCCVDRLSWIKSSLFSRERTFDSMSVGRAGLVGLALSLTRIPPRLPRFRPFSHRLRRCLVRVASVIEAAASRSGFSRVCVCMRCRYPKGFGDHRCVLEWFPYELAVNLHCLETNRWH